MASSSSPRFSIASDSDLTSPTSQRSAFPFPRQDSYSGPPPIRYQPRRGSAASSISGTSIGGALDTNSHNRERRNSSVRETSQNAISTLLQPPIVKTGLLPHTQQSAGAGYKPPSTRDIPPVTLSNVPHVPPERFRDYLNRIAPLFETFQRARNEPEQTPWTKKDGEQGDVDRSGDAWDDRLRPTDSPTSPTFNRRESSVLSPLESPNQSRRRSSAQRRRRRNEPTPLNTIPNVYFDENFKLENPRTFGVVSERAEIVRPPPGTPAAEPQKGANGSTLPPRKSLATNAILQEKLSWYMDTVEVHLINSISTASTGFFAALGSLRELQTEAEESVTKIKGLREDLRKLDKDVAMGGLEVAAKRRRMENVRKLEKATAQVHRVVEDARRADELVDDGLYNEAADQMDRIGKLICGQAKPDDGGGELLDLRPLKALQGLDSSMQELQYRIGAGFANRFTRTLIEDLRQHSEKVPSEDTLKRWSRQRGISPVYMETSPQLRKDLLASLDGLARAQHTAAATTAFREAAMKEMKALIRRQLPSSNDDDADSTVSTMSRGAGSKLSGSDKSAMLARNLRAMDTEDFEAMLVKIYTSVGEALRRISTQTKVLLDVTSSIAQPSNATSSPPKSPNPSSIDSQIAPSSRPKPQEDLFQTMDMSSLLGQAVDAVHTQINRILKVRNEQSIRLPPARFLRYFTLNRLFVDECEAVSGRSGQALKAIINAQISGFVQVLAQSETERVAKMLDEESWEAKNFGAEGQEHLQQILMCIEKDPPEWSAAKPIWEPLPAVEELPTNNHLAVPNGNATPALTPGGSRAPPTPARLNDSTSYVLVPSTAALLPTLTLFLSLTAKLPSYTPALATALLDVLRTFNSRTHQLILGAGATKIAGLKNITTKHLALASQSLGFVGQGLLPYLREGVRRHLPRDQTQNSANKSAQAVDSNTNSNSNSSATNPLADFDKMRRVYSDHQTSIHDKLVDIMTSRSAAHAKALAQINYDHTGTSTQTATASPPIETLIKETTTLHRVLTRLLAEGEVRFICRQLCERYLEQWRGVFGNLGVPGSKEGRSGLRRDVRVFEERLGRLEGFAGLVGRVGEGAVGRLGGDDDDDDRGKGGKGKEKEGKGEEQERGKGKEDSEKGVGGKQDGEQSKKPEGSEKSSGDNEGTKA
ncbi:hypothetical protein MBLNU230_g0596t1 [Neophaeotheca triangularis]